MIDFNLKRELFHGEYSFIIEILSSRNKKGGKQVYFDAPISIISKYL